MTTTCANCRAEVGDAAYCPQCGQPVLSPQSAPDWRTDTTERPAVRAPFEPPPAVTTPGPPRFPLYADQAGDSVEAHVDPRSQETPTHPTYFAGRPGPRRRRAPRRAGLAAVGDHRAGDGPGGRGRGLAAPLARRRRRQRHRPAGVVRLGTPGRGERRARAELLVRRGGGHLLGPAVGDRARRRPGRRGRHGGRHGATRRAAERRRLRQPDDVRRRQHGRRPRRHLLADGRRRHRHGDLLRPRRDRRP